jgi:hypothetical protein
MAGLHYEIMITMLVRADGASKEQVHTVLHARAGARPLGEVLSGFPPAAT